MIKCKFKFNSNNSNLIINKTSPKNILQGNDNIRSSRGLISILHRVKYQISNPINLHVVYYVIGINCFLAYGICKGINISF